MNCSACGKAPANYIGTGMLPDPNKICACAPLTPAGVFNGVPCATTHEQKEVARLAVHDLNVAAEANYCCDLTVKNGAPLGAKALPQTLPLTNVNVMKGREAPAAFVSQRGAADCSLKTMMLGAAASARSAKPQYSFSYDTIVQRATGAAIAVADNGCAVQDFGQLGPTSRMGWKLAMCGNIPENITNFGPAVEPIPVDGLIAGGAPSPAPAPAPGPGPLPPPGPGIQLLSNADFLYFNPSTGSASNWTSTFGWNSYNNLSSNDPSSGSRVACINPLYFTRGGFEPLIYGSNTGYLIFSYNTDTVTQTVNIDSLVGLNYITCEISARALEQVSGLQATNDELTFKVDYYDVTNTLLTTVSSNLTSVLNNTFGTYQLAIDRSSFLGFDNITKATVSIIAKDGGFWLGFYGPIVDYCTLTVS